MINYLRLINLIIKLIDNYKIEIEYKIIISIK